jgi:hypothetical protein
MAGRLMTMQRSVKTGIPVVSLLCDKSKRDIGGKTRSLSFIKKHFVSFRLTFTRFLSFEKASFARAIGQQKRYQF